MLDDKELAKLCHGRIVFAEVLDSANNAPARPIAALTNRRAYLPRRG